MPSDDRDQKFERALAQHLRGGSAQANCPDAETLAAYHERNLSLEEMAHWKQHFSACEICREALALVESTETQLAEDWEERGVPVRNAKTSASNAPQAAVTRVAMLRGRPALLRWAVPLGAVAAGVLVFIGIYEQRRPKVVRYSDTIIARRQSPNEPSQMLDQQAAKAQPQSVPKDEQALTAEMSVREKEKALSAVPPAKAKVPGDELRASRDQFVGGRLEKKTLAPSTPVPGIPAQASADAADSVTAPAAASAAPPPAPAVLGGSAGGAAAQRPQAHADAKSVSPSAPETIAVEPPAAPSNGRANRMMMKQGVANEVVEVTGSGAGLILTPDNNVFWKLQPAGTLQLTTDGGKNWKLLDTGANANLTSGFAPSSRVCWLAGKAGTLLLTTDRGGHWTRISTPITGDLGSVHAADAQHASIWDAANHASYETSDGGATWKQIANE
jgi:Photosynthesis system II assembly factor YCF48